MSLFAMENETLFFKIFKLYKMEYQLLITVGRGHFLMVLCAFKHMYVQAFFKRPFNREVRKIVL